MNLEDSLKPAGFFRRLLAYIFDLFFKVILIMPFTALSGYFIGLSEVDLLVVKLSNRIPLSFYLFSFFIILLSFFISYTYLFWTQKKWQATLGKKLLGMKVIYTNVHCPLWKSVFLREFVGKILSSLFLEFGFLMVLFTKDKHALHDSIAQSKVVVVS